MFSLLLNPLVRVFAIGVVGVVLVLYGIHALKEEARREIEAKATADALRRVENAVRAGDAVDVSPDGLLKNDGHRRD